MLNSLEDTSPAKAGAQLGAGRDDVQSSVTSTSPTGPRPSPGNGTRTDWTRAEIAALFDLPFDELMYRAQTVHRAHHAVSEVQLCTLLSIKTGGCPEDCGYCSQSASADTQLKAEKLVRELAAGVRAGGADRAA